MGDSEGKSEAKTNRLRRPQRHTATWVFSQARRRGCDCLESPAVQALGHCMSPHAHRSFFTFKVIHGAWTVFDTLRIGIPVSHRARTPPDRRRGTGAGPRALVLVPLPGAYSLF